MKKKITITAIVLFVLSFIFALLFYNKFNPVQISAPELSKAYSINKSDADKKYLDKTIIITGKVKAFYKLLGTRKVLELQTSGYDEPIFCFFFNERDENTAGRLAQDEEVKLKVKCTGTETYSFVKGIKLEVDKIYE